MEEHIKEQQKIIGKRYDSMADTYAATGKIITAHRQDAIQELNVQQHEKILDLACGPGINYEPLVRRIEKDGSIVGLDHSGGMLLHANKKAKLNQWKNCISVRGDASTLPFEDGSFDKVLCTYSLNVIPNYKQTLDEVKRILQVGGLFVVLDGKMRSDILRVFNGFIRVMTAGPMSDSTRPLLEEVHQRFSIQKIKEYDLGYTFLAVAQK